MAEEIRAAGGRAAVTIADVADPAGGRASHRGGRRRRSAGSTSWSTTPASAAKRDFADLDYREWREILATTLDGAYLCSRAALPHLVAAGGGVDRQHRRVVGAYRRQPRGRTSLRPRPGSSG